MTLLKEHLDVLAGCRFCPMCKPASETGRLLQVESYSTRARGMMLWSIATGYAEWTDRKSEIVFQSTRDGISESWCVSHRPVSEYVLDARRDLWAAGRVPAEVKAVAQREVASIVEIQPGQRAVLFAGEFADVADVDGAQRAASLLRVGLIYAASGFTPYSLGATEVADAQIEAAQKLVGEAETVIADGPQTEYMLRQVWPDVGFDVISISDALIGAIDNGDLATVGGIGPVLFHDSRAASYLADSLAVSRGIDPSFSGPEEDLGTGASFERPRELLERVGVDRVGSRWSRSFSRSCGSDDGLWVTYPDIAGGLATEAVDAAKNAGAGCIVVDSPVSVVVLGDAAGDDIDVAWVGDLVETA